MASVDDNRIKAADMNGEPGAALDEELARRIKDAVDAGFDDQIAFLQ